MCCISEARQENQSTARKSQSRTSDFTFSSTVTSGTFWAERSIHELDTRDTSVTSLMRVPYSRNPQFVSGICRSRSDLIVPASPITSVGDERAFPWEVEKPDSEERTSQDLAPGRLRFLKLSCSELAIETAAAAGGLLATGELEGDSSPRCQACSGRPHRASCIRPGPSGTVVAVS